jgi:DNA-binding XRE family transcriptional regulator
MLPDKIKQLREQAGLSQSQLAKKLDVTRSTG